MESHLRGHMYKHARAYARKTKPNQINEDKICNLLVEVELQVNPRLDLGYCFGLLWSRTDQIKGFDGGKLNFDQP